jgi:hypothetical protein
VQDSEGGQAALRLDFISMREGGWERLEVGDEWGSEQSGLQVLVGRTLRWTSEEKIRKMRRLGCQGYRAETRLGRNEK